MRHEPTLKGMCGRHERQRAARPWATCGGFRLREATTGDKETWGSKARRRQTSGGIDAPAPLAAPAPPAENVPADHAVAPPAAERMARCPGPWRKAASQSPRTACLPVPPRPGAHDPAAFMRCMMHGWRGQGAPDKREQARNQRT